MRAAIHKAYFGNRVQEGQKESKRKGRGLVKIYAITPGKWVTDQAEAVSEWKAENKF